MMKAVNSLLLCGGLMLSCGFIVKSQSLVNDPESIRENVSRYLSPVGRYGIGGQVLIAGRQGIIINKAFGYANRERRIPVTGETIFELASTSKMFTACAILKLEMDGKLSVDDSLATFFTSAPTDKAGITIHQLLTHTSGIAGGDLVEDFAGITKEELVAKILGEPLESRPGTQWKYSNAGYNLLAAIIEKVSGKDYGRYLSDTFFKPLSMNNTFVNGARELLTRKVAVDYQGARNNGGPDRQVFNPRTWGGGSVCSTVDDLYKWVKALQDRQILDEKAWIKFSKPHVKIARDNNYGYGCFPYQLNGRNILDAIGSTERGANCTVRMYLDEGITYLLLANSSEPMGPFSRQFIDPRIRHFIFEKETISFPTPAKKLQPSILKEYTGNYTSGTDTISIITQGDNLVLRAKGQSAIDFIMGHTDRQRQRIELLVRKVALYVNDFKDTSIAGFEQVLTPEQLPAYVEERNSSVRQYGRLHSNSIDGAYIDADTNFIVCHIRMNFEKKSVNYFTMWNVMDNKMMIDFTEMNAPPADYAKILVPRGADKWVAYDFLKAQPALQATIKKERDQTLHLTNDKSQLIFSRR